MLNDYIEAYRIACQNNDQKEAKRIEKELASLGMDKATLSALIETTNLQ